MAKTETVEVLPKPVGTYVAHIKCANCSQSPAIDGVVTGAVELPSMHSVGMNTSVRVYEGNKFGKTQVKHRLEYEFVCMVCGRKVWIQVNDPAYS